MVSDATPTGAKQTGANASASVGAGKRAVVLVGGPVAPYSRALRIARALAAEGFDVEIAAVAAPGLPNLEHVQLRPSGTTMDRATGTSSKTGIALTRYRPRGWEAILGATDDTTRGDPASMFGRLGASSSLRRLLRLVAAPLIEIRRWILWPHTVRGWWSTLRQDLRAADLYHACGALTVAAALDGRSRHPFGTCGRRPRVIYDVIDLAAESNTASAMPGPVRRRIARIDAGWQRDADGLVAVNEEIAERLQTMTPSRPVAVVPNLPEWINDGDGERRVAPLREAAGLPAGARIVLVHGRLGPDLGLEEAADAILAVPHATLVVIGFGRGLAASRARDRDLRFEGRHRTLDAVHPDEIVRWTAAADVCLIPLPPISVNQRLSTPNKFWEAIAGGTPVVVVRGMVAMERLVREHDLGAVAASPAAADLASAINAVLDREETIGPAWRARILAFASRNGGWPTAAATYRAFVADLVRDSA